MRDTFSVIHIRGVYCLLASNVWAYDDCEFKKRIDTTLDLSAASQLNINARAGGLKVVGDADSGEAIVEAVICASEEKWADESWLEMESGKTAAITVVDPRSNDSSWYENEQFSVDLTVSIPPGMALSIMGSSGALSVEGSGDLSIQDSSGDIHFKDVEDDFVVERDSSGSIVADTIGGDFRVLKDGSGSIKATNVSGEIDIPEKN